jgi:cell division protein FtsB
MNMKSEDMGTETKQEPEIPEDPQTQEQVEPEQDEPGQSQPEELEISQPEQETTAETKPKKEPPSRFMRFLRKALIVLAVVAIIFFAGFLTDHFTRYRPLSDELDQTRAELEQAKLDLGGLEEENDSLTNANQAANNEIAEMKDELTAARANLLFYQVMVDVNTAQLELFLENIEGAKAALADSEGNLEELSPYINEVDPELALSLPRRLELIISGLERDPETARIDLELLTKDLLELEPLLVGE